MLIRTLIMTLVTALPLTPWAEPSVSLNATALSQHYQVPKRSILWKDSVSIPGLPSLIQVCFAEIKKGNTHQLVTLAQVPCSEESGSSCYRRISSSALSFQSKSRARFGGLFDLDTPGNVSLHKDFSHDAPLPKMVDPILVIHVSEPVAQPVAQPSGNRRVKIRRRGPRAKPPSHRHTTHLYRVGDTDFQRILTPGNSPHEKTVGWRVRREGDEVYLDQMVRYHPPYPLRRRISDPYAITYIMRDDRFVRWIPPPSSTTLPTSSPTTPGPTTLPTSAPIKPIPTTLPTSAPTQPAAMPQPTTDTVE